MCKRFVWIMCVRCGQATTTQNDHDPCPRLSLRVAIWTWGGRGGDALKLAVDVLQGQFRDARVPFFFPHLVCGEVHG